MPAGRQGFTLIEMVVAVAVFILVITAASGLFVFSLKAQRQSLAYQELLDQSSYLMEYMSRAIRMAQKDIAGTCTGTAKINYAFSGQCLKFINYKDQCQQFCLDNGRLKDESGNYLTSDELSVSSFNVNLSGQSQDDNLQPRVAFSMSITGQEEASIQLQTTISQRNLDIKK